MLKCHLFLSNDLHNAKLLTRKIQIKRGSQSHSGTREPFQREHGRYCALNPIPAGFCTSPCGAAACRATAWCDAGVLHVSPALLPMGTSFLPSAPLPFLESVVLGVGMYPQSRGKMGCTKPCGCCPDSLSLRSLLGSPAPYLGLLWLQAGKGPKPSCLFHAPPNLSWSVLSIKVEQRLEGN